MRIRLPCYQGYRLWVNRKHSTDLLIDSALQAQSEKTSDNTSAGEIARREKCVGAFMTIFVN